MGSGGFNVKHQVKLAGNNGLNTFRVSDCHTSTTVLPGGLTQDREISMSDNKRSSHTYLNTLQKLGQGWTTLCL